jgi:hypothetical protein
VGRKIRRRKNLASQEKLERVGREKGIEKTFLLD